MASPISDRASSFDEIVAQQHLQDLAAASSILDETLHKMEQDIESIKAKTESLQHRVKSIKNASHAMIVVSASIALYAFACGVRRYL